MLARVREAGDDRELPGGYPRDLEGISPRSFQGGKVSARSIRDEEALDSSLM